MAEFKYATSHTPGTRPFGKRVKRTQEPPRLAASSGTGRSGTGAASCHLSFRRTLDASASCAAPLSRAGLAVRVAAALRIA